MDVQKEQKSTYLTGFEDFCFYYMFKTNFSGRNKIWGGTKEILVELPPNAPPLATGLPCNPQTLGQNTQISSANIKISE